MAVIASGLLGMIQGAATTNVVATGSVTIPMMKRLGYKPHFAGAVEAVSSTGGQIMPPVMGTAAFVMAQFLGIPYLSVAIAAVIPAVLYYTANFMAVHFAAKKWGLIGLPKEEIPSLRATFASGWPILIPVFVLIFFLARGYGIGMCGIYASISLLIITSLRKQSRLSPVRLLVALEEAGKMAVIVAIACAAAGIIIGASYVSGLGDKLATTIVLLSGGQLLPALVLTAVVSLILGMAMPVTASYVTVVMVAVPALMKLGCSALSAHFFCFFYAALSNITPPVAMAAYVAAGLAGANMIRTGLTACGIACAIYIVPFYFIYDPVMLMVGEPWRIIQSFITGFFGVTAIAGGFEGWFMRRQSWLERILLFAAGINLIIPGLITDVIGLVLLGTVVLLNRRFGYYEILDPVLALPSRLFARSRQGSRSLGKDQ